MDSNKTIWWVLGFIAFAAIGFVVLPPFIKRVSSRLYKASNKKADIDYDNLGPEIVKKDDDQKEE